MKFGAIVTGQGRLVFDRRPEWEAALASFAGKVDRQGKPLRVTLSLERETPVAAQLPGGVEVQPEVSSTALSTVQWEEWSARIRDHAAHVWRLRIPEPNEPEEVAV